MTDIYTSAHVLYKMFDGQDRLLYVGITAHPPLRFRNHSETKEWWSRVVTIRLQSFESRMQLAEAERQAIIAEKPEFNVVHSTRPRRKETVTGIRVVTYALSEIVEAGLAPSEHWLAVRLRAGEIRGRKVGRHWRMSDADVDALLESLANDTKSVEMPPVGPTLITGGITARSASRRGSA